MKSRGDNAAETFRAILRTGGLIGRVMAPHFARYGIRPAQWAVLRVLDRAEKEGLNGLKVMELGERLLIRPPSVTGVVDRMERMGLVSRHADTIDLRVKQVRLTATGREMLAKILAGHGKRIEQVLGGLSSQEQGELKKHLHKLCQHLETLAASGEMPSAEEE